jgi:hypothetical protein
MVIHGALLHPATSPYLSQKTSALHLRYFGREPLEMSAVVALLRIGDKYMIPVLRKEAVNRICLSYPSTLDEADEIWDQASVHNGIKNSSSVHTLFHVANSIYEGGVDSALPLIFLKCAMESLVSLVSPHVADDGDSSAVCLLPDVLSIVMWGRERMMQSYISLLYPWLQEDYNHGLHCSSPAACRIARGKAAQRILAKAQPEWYEFRELYWTEDWVFGMCDSCKSIAKDDFIQGARKFWNSIPEAFGLISWGEVKAQMD